MAGRFLESWTSFFDETNRKSLLVHLSIKGGNVLKHEIYFLRTGCARKRLRDETAFVTYSPFALGSCAVQATAVEHCTKRLL